MLALAMTGPRQSLASLSSRIERLVRAIQDEDEAVVESIVRLSQSRRLFAPLAFTVGAFAMLLDGLKLLLSNWRLTLVQILPAVWIWLAMFDLKARVLRDKSFPALRGPVLIPIALAIVAITMACFFLNACSRFRSHDRLRPRSDRHTAWRAAICVRSSLGAPGSARCWRSRQPSLPAGAALGLPLLLARS